MRLLLAACLFLLASVDKTEFRGVKSLAEFSRKHHATLLLYFNNENYFRIVSGGTVREMSVQSKLFSRDACCPHRATPSLSRDGRELAYVRLLNAVPREEALAILNLESGASVDVFRAEAIWSASWSPDGRRIAVVADQKDGRLHQLVIVDHESGAARSVVTGPVTMEGIVTTVSDNAVPAWSPDGSRLAIELHARSQSREPVTGVIMILDLKDGSMRKIADGFAPSWSPSGQVAFLDESRGRSMFITGEGGRPVILFNAPRGFLIPGKGAPLFFRPVWSPDGTHLLFHQWRDADLVTEVYEFDLVRKKALRVATSEVQVVDWISVSPDQGSR